MRLEQQTEVKRFISFFTRGFNYCVTAKVLEINEEDVSHCVKMGV